MVPLESLFESEFTFLIRQTRENKTPETLKSIQKEDKKYGDQRIAKLFYPLILVMRCVGTCPVQIIRNGGVLRYKGKYLSLPFILTSTIGSMFGLIILVFVLNSIFKIDYPIKL